MIIDLTNEKYKNLKIINLTKKAIF